MEKKMDETDTIKKKKMDGIDILFLVSNLLKGKSVFVDRHLRWFLFPKDEYNIAFYLCSLI